MFDGSGSGSGCFDITTVSGLCDVSLKIRLSINIKARTRYVHVLVKKLLHNFFRILRTFMKISRRLILFENLFVKRVHYKFGNEK